MNYMERHPSTAVAVEGTGEVELAWDGGGGISGSEGQGEGRFKKKAPDLAIGGFQ